ncbi:MAG: hypothetical protein Q8932_20800, partial [Bacteroidota bacterium]|nr:hypothetical protein [Bacteroidota bacterium]
MDAKIAINFRLFERTTLAIRGQAAGLVNGQEYGGEQRQQGGDGNSHELNALIVEIGGGQGSLRGCAGYCADDLGMEQQDGDG